MIPMYHFRVLCYQLLTLCLHMHLTLFIVKDRYIVPPTLLPLQFHERMIELNPSHSHLDHHLERNGACKIIRIVPEITQ